MRPVHTSVLASLFVLSFVSLAAAQPSRLTVRIESPSAGVETDETLSFRAVVSDPRALRATLTVNGASYDVPIVDGAIEQTLVPMPGNNRVGVVVEHGGRVARDSLSFRYEGPATEMMVMLTWEAHGEIIDLWVRDPDGQTCKWDRREIPGGGLLDFSSTAIGFGSQAFVAHRVEAGRYRIKVHYWGAYDSEDAHAFYGLDEMLAELDGLGQPPTTPREAAAFEERRRVLTERIDGWALGAGSQTPVRAEVVLFPGTPSEQRHRFELTVERTGQLATLGEIEITAAQIRAARTEER